jgi:hypothetical protein
LNKHKKALVAVLLEAASDEFANHGCNDYEFENTDENWKLICDMEDWNGTKPADRRERPNPGKKIMTYDWYVMSYLAACLKKESESE